MSVSARMEGGREEQHSPWFWLSTATAHGFAQEGSDSSNKQGRAVVATRNDNDHPDFALESPQKLCLRGGAASTRKRGRSRRTPSGLRYEPSAGAAAAVSGSGTVASPSGAGAAQTASPAATPPAATPPAATPPVTTPVPPTTPLGTPRRGPPSVTANSNPNKRRTLPIPSSSRIIPGSLLPNSGRHALPKGTMMEMMQVRDLEIIRLMEEMQDSEDEVTILTHEVQVLNDEKTELKMQIQEMSRDMANIQYAANNIKLQKDSGPSLIYWQDNDISNIWDRLFLKVIEFCNDLCYWREDGNVDYLGAYRPEASAKYEGGPVGHWGTFEAFLNDKGEGVRPKIAISQWYLRELASDVLGNVYPGRLDAFIGEDKANELLPTAMVMKILQKEVFEKIRWFLRSEPFWDPVEFPYLQKDGDQPDTSPDFVVQQEHSSSANDAVAYEFNCLRAKMLLHFTEQRGGFSTAMINYLSRIGVVILHAIHPFLTIDCIDYSKLGKHKAPRSQTLYTFQDYIKDDPIHPKADIEKKLHNILTAAMQLALIMRTDNSVTYLDGGGLNLPWSSTMMENVAPLTAPYKDGEAEIKEYMDDTADTFCWLVVAPCIKRTGNEDGTGYNQARVVCKSKVALRYGKDPKSVIANADGWTY